MKADSLTMSRVFQTGGDIQYVLPHFQREYAWGETEWKTLLTDIFSVYEIYREEQPPEHFMGSLVVISDGMQAGVIPVFRLVDGQQRLATISLMLCALERLLDDQEEFANVRRRARRMLVNLDETGNLHYKLLPTLKYGDRASYCAIIEGRQPPEGVKSRVPDAYRYLSAQIKNRLDTEGVDPNRLFNVLMTSLQVVFINLNQNERPYEIFESLNFKGKPLTQADLVRNYIAMKLPPQRQEHAFTELWSPVEEMLLERQTVGRSRLGELTAFMRHYFAYLYGVLINEEHVYSRFRDRGEAMTVEQFESELRQIKRFAGYYDRLLRPDNEPDRDVRGQLEAAQRPRDVDRLPVPAVRVRPVAAKQNHTCAVAGGAAARRGLHGAPFPQSRLQQLSQQDVPNPRAETSTPPTSSSRCAMGSARTTSPVTPACANRLRHSTSIAKRSTPGRNWRSSSTPLTVISRRAQERIPSSATILPSNTSCRSPFPTTGSGTWGRAGSKTISCSTRSATSPW